MTPMQLRRLRAAVKYTQQEMCDLVNVTKRTYQRWERIGQYGVNEAYSELFFSRILEIFPDLNLQEILK